MSKPLYVALKEIYTEDSPMTVLELLDKLIKKVEEYETAEPQPTPTVTYKPLYRHNVKINGADGTFFNCTIFNDSSEPFSTSNFPAYVRANFDVVNCIDGVGYSYNTSHSSRSWIAYGLYVNSYNRYILHCYYDSSVTNQLERDSVEMVVTTIYDAPVKVCYTPVAD